MKKTKFNMATLIDLYKNDLSKWREYLYNNLEVFISGTEFYVWKQYYMDIKHDLFIILDDSIKKSVDVYWERQIYNYIRKRVRWHLINCKFWLSEFESATVESWESYDSSEKIWIDIMVEKVKEYVLQLPIEQKTVMLMRMFTEPAYTNKEIAEYLNKKESHISRTYKKVMVKIQKVLAHLQHEDIY